MTATDPEADRSTAGERIPIRPPGQDTASKPIEDYEDLGSTFLDSHGNYQPIAQVIEIADDPGPPPIAWGRLFVYIPAAIFLSALAVLMALGLVPVFVLCASGVAVVLLGMWLTGRHSIRRMRPEHARDYKRGAWSTPAAARAHAAATLYKQRQAAWRTQRSRR